MKNQRFCIQCLTSTFYSLIVFWYHHILKWEEYNLYWFLKMHWHCLYNYNRNTFIVTDEWRDTREGGRKTSPPGHPAIKRTRLRHAACESLVVRKPKNTCSMVGPTWYGQKSKSKPKSRGQWSQPRPATCHNPNCDRNPAGASFRLSKVDVT